MSKKEIEVLIGLIDDFQCDGAEWTINNINLRNLKKKLKGIKSNGR